jgi:predicted RNA-binding Zn ribbon-like protein
MATFSFVSGNPALDLTGTVGRRTSDRIELLTGPERLESWLTGAELLFADTIVRTDDLDAVLRLREAVYSLATAASNGGGYDSTARVAINEFAAMAPPHMSIAEDGSLRRSGGTPAAISLLARSAVELLTGDSARLIRECASPQCTRLYVDSSVRGSRRWCDMRMCGNRAKVANFRTRHPAGQVDARNG